MKIHEPWSAAHFFSQCLNLRLIDQKPGSNIIPVAYGPVSIKLGKFQGLSVSNDWQGVTHAGLAPLGLAKNFANRSFVSIEMVNHVTAVRIDDPVGL